MTTHTRRTRPGSLTARLTIVATLAGSLFACYAKDGKIFDVFGTEVTSTGSVIGTILGLTGQNMTLTLNPGGLVTTSGSGGSYGYTNLIPRTYTLEGSPVAGLNCVPLIQTLLVTANATTQAQQINCTAIPGSIAGRVTVNGQGQSGVTVTLGTRTTQTNQNGDYSFADVPPGAQTVQINPPPNTTCTPGTSQAVTVTAGQQAPANFNCTANTGSLNGTLMHNGMPVPNATVTIGNQTALTDALGRFLFTNLVVGAIVAVVSNQPAYMTCPNGNANILAGQAVTLSIVCATIAFNLVLTGSYRHFVGFSEVCLLIATSAALANVAYTASVSGPGVSGSGQHSGTLDAQGQALLRNTITLFGTYTWLVNVLGTQATRAIIVNAAAGTCT